MFTLEDIPLDPCLLARSIPEPARRLARLLNHRGVVYQGEKIKPSWKVLKTNRVQSENPNIQGQPEKERSLGLATGLLEGEELFALDYKAAEPTLISAMLGYHADKPLYELLAEGLNITRGEAKKQINRLHYSNSSVAVCNAWPGDIRDRLNDYAVQLDKLKSDLWLPRGGSDEGSRRIITLCETVLKGVPEHSGAMLSWVIQGTVADIVNRASLEIMERESSQKWRYVCPVHDSVYVAAFPNLLEELEEIMSRCSKGSAGSGLADIIPGGLNTTVKKWPEPVEHCVPILL